MEKPLHRQIYCLALQYISFQLLLSVEATENPKYVVAVKDYITENQLGCINVTQTVILCSRLRDWSFSNMLLGVFFSAAPTARNSPDLYFRFIDYFIQPSRVRSLAQNHRVL